jgi:hypothetical protein
MTEAAQQQVKEVQKPPTFTAKAFAAQSAMSRTPTVKIRTGSSPTNRKIAAQQGTMDAWFHLKNDEWHANPQDRAAHADDDHGTISPTGDLPKLQHVAELAMARKLYGEHGVQPDEPVRSMRMFDFGNVVIQKCLQGPKGSAQPRAWFSEYL